MFEDPAIEMSTRFGEFVLDPDRRLLLREGREIHVSPKAFQLLEVLLERRPSAVAKQILFDVVWPDTFIAESNLASLIRELRTALVDDARRPRFIRTIHGYGYAFCGEVRIEAADRDPGLKPVGILLWGSRPIPLYEGAAVIGRDSSADITIEDTTVSRRHAVIETREGQIILRDLQSKNGTYVGGRPLKEEVRLADGDLIELGSVRLVYRESVSTVTTTSVIRPQSDGGEC